MDKTININLGGVLFHIDEEAYRILRDYLQAVSDKLKNLPGSSETLDDIELRIAEIFLSQKSTAGVISRATVEDMINIIGNPNDFSQPGDEKAEAFSPRTYGKKMQRNSNDRIIGGVCSGIGNYLGAEPVLLRIFFIILTLMFGIGILVYLALWLALPAGETLPVPQNQAVRSQGYGFISAKEDGSYKVTGDIGNAFNEIFRAIVKFTWIIIRILIIFLGISVVVTGFLAIAAFIMVFVFRFPGEYSVGSVGFKIAYLPDFLNYVVTPSLVPWIKALTIIAVIIPLLVMIYLGIRMIFWFRAKDGAFLLTGLIIWVMAVAILSIMLFNEGLSFVETARFTTKEYFKTVPDTVYLKLDSKVSDLQFDNEISFGDEGYYIFVKEENKQIYVRSYFNDITFSEGRPAFVEITKRSNGRSKTDAARNAEKLLYNYKISGDTLFIDEYFTYSEGSKWSFDEIRVDIVLPRGTILYLDKTADNLLRNNRDYFISDPSDRYLVVTEDGAEYPKSRDYKKF